MSNIVSNSGAIPGNANVGGTLSVTGTAILNSGVTVNSAATFNGTVYSSGGVTLATNNVIMSGGNSLDIRNTGNVIQIGNSAFGTHQISNGGSPLINFNTNAGGDSVVVSVPLSANSSATFNSNVGVTGNFSVSGNTSLSANLTLTGTAFFANNLTWAASNTWQMNGGNVVNFGWLSNSATALRISSNVNHITLDNLNNITMLSAPTLATKSVSQNATATVNITAQSTATAGDNRRLFTNVGSTTTQVTYNLPAAAVGMDYSFTVEDSGGMIIDANGTDQIRYVSTTGTGVLGGAGGTITTTVQGASIRISCHKAGFWSVQSVIGTIGAAATNWVVT